MCLQVYICVCVCGVITLLICNTVLSNWSLVPAQLFFCACVCVCVCVRVRVCACACMCVCDKVQNSVCVIPLVVMVWCVQSVVVVEPVALVNCMSYCRL